MGGNRGKLWHSLRSRVNQVLPGQKGGHRGGCAWVVRSRQILKNIELGQRPAVYQTMLAARAECLCPRVRVRVRDLSLCLSEAGVDPFDTKTYFSQHVFPKEMY